MKHFKLIGGPHNGQSMQIDSWVPVIYLSVPITAQEAQQLFIDDCVMWKAPEAVYRKRVAADGQAEFHFDKIVSYKPETENAI